MEITPWGRMNMPVEIVEASFAPGSSVSMAARGYDVNTNQVFGWRKLYRQAFRRWPIRPRRGSLTSSAASMTI
jgi:transposase-like protein